MEARRGEIADLETKLKALAGKGSGSTEVRDARRALFQRVTLYMTLNVDLSPLFSTMLMNAATADVPSKKMLYLYFTNTATAKPDLALLVVNMLLKDSRDVDPTIRALALRSLSGLRVASLAEYICEALLKGLSDAHPYPRKTAALGILKLNDLAPATVAAAGLLDALKRGLTLDSSADVCANCLAVLRELVGLRELATKSVVYNLLNRVREFNEWGQCLVLELTSAYVPSSADEMFDIMNLLEDRLRHNNSAVVLATTRVFLQLTLAHADVHQAVYERIKAPLFTLAGAGSGEVAYAVWAHLHLLVCRAPTLFASDFRQFYCRASDSSAIKRLKLEMLTAVADASNTYDIVTEVSEYVTDVDVGTSRRSVRAIGEIAIRASDVAGIVDRLLTFLDLGSDHVVSEALGVVKDVLRRFPERAEACIAAVSALNATAVTEPAGRAAYTFIMGEYGAVLPEAPYALEPSLLALAEESSPEVRLELLTAAMKLFLQRPAECQRMLGAALAAGCEDAHTDVRDRAQLYYRLLRVGGAEGARSVVCAGGEGGAAAAAAAVGGGGEDYEQSAAADLRDRLFGEFNTLSVVYAKPASAFVDGRDRATAAAAAAREEAEAAPAATAGDSLLVDLGAEDDLPPVQAHQPSVPLYVSPVPVPVAPTPPPAAQLPPCPLAPSPVLDPATFQARWTEWPAAQQGTIAVPAGARARLGLPGGVTSLTPHMAQAGFATMACGGQAPTLKWYFHAKGAERGTFLAELVVQMAEAGWSACITVKTDEAGSSKAFAANFAHQLLSFA